MPRPVKAPVSEPLFFEPEFNENVLTPDPRTFRTPHDPKKDEELYKQVQNLLKKDTVSFPAARGKPSDLLTLASSLGSQGPADVEYIQKSGKIIFHAVGDTGASILGKLPGELSVADHLANDYHTSTRDNLPSFLFHLGDVVYDFGESQYYYDQFYEPFRNYPAPIFVIPGNHDSFVIPGTRPADAPLTTFMRNFCSTRPVITKDAGSLHRTSMTQPGVYFALDAPFVRVIGLFSNALEDPGVISSQKGQPVKWPGVPDYQLAFLTAQLARIKEEQFPGAVIIAVHHPPFTYEPPQETGGTGGHHMGNALMLAQIDAICKEQGVYPHAFISGHSHNYQRYTRKLSFDGKNYSVPFVVAGNGGHNVTPLVQARGGVMPHEPTPGEDVHYLDSTGSGLTLDQSDDKHYGYLRIIVDSEQLRIEYHPVSPAAPPSEVDTVVVNIADHSVV